MHLIASQTTIGINSSNDRISGGTALTEIRIEKQSTSHHLINGDALEILPTIETESVELIFVDPPYNIGKDFGLGSVNMAQENYLRWMREWFEHLVRILHPNGSMYIMNATQNMAYIDMMARERLHVMSRIIWHYDSSGVQAKKSYGSMYEPILHCVKDEQDYTFNLEDVLVPARTGSVRKLIDHRKKPPEPYSTVRNPGNVWYFPRVRYRMPEYMEHPSQKPELLLERILLASSNEGDVVLDPFAGTFTTSTVATKIRRNSISIELSQEYFEKGVKRVNQTNEGSEIANKHNQPKQRL